MQLNITNIGTAGKYIATDAATLIPEELKSINQWINWRAGAKGVAMETDLPPERLTHLDLTLEGAISIERRFKSNIDSANWRGDLTTFNSFYDVLPNALIEQADWNTVTRTIAGEVAIGPDKSQHLFFVPCLLKDAPFTPKTLPKAQAAGLGTNGKQRSSAHMTQATWVVMDIDGMAQSAFDEKVNSLAKSGYTFLIYSTHSHGREDRPGVRARLVVPVDRSLAAEDYESAWLGLDKLVFGGEVVKADGSGRHLWQQQGVWATATERQHKAFSISQDGAVWAADELIRNAPLKPSGTSKLHHSPELSPTEQVDRLVSALPWLDAEDTPTWISAITALKAASTIIGESNGLALAIQYSDRGSTQARMKNESDRRYDPATFFFNVNPVMPASAGVGVLLGLAKQTAIQTLLADRGKDAWSELGSQAASYLCRHHYKAFVELTTGGGGR